MRAYQTKRAVLTDPNKNKTRSWICQLYIYMQPLTFLVVQFPDKSSYEFCFTKGSLSLFIKGSVSKALLVFQLQSNSKWTFCH